MNDLRERWRVNGQIIDRPTWRAAAQRAADAEHAANQSLTYFERCFVIACCVAVDMPGAHFLCEVGLGGRLDCANALDAKAVILAHLSLDHCHVLGDTLEAIATEKLGVARPNAPLFIANQSPPARRAIEHVLDDTITPTWTDPLTWPCGIPGTHQHGNVATAWAAAQYILDTPQQSVAQSAVRMTALSARCQLVTRSLNPNSQTNNPAQDQHLLIDGAHNGPSIEATLSVAHEFFGNQWYLIVGVAGDKDIEAICEVIAHKTSTDCTILRCGYHGERSRSHDQWPVMAQQWQWHDNITEAVASIPADQNVCVTGSFYLAGEALEYLNAASDVPG